MKPPPPTHVFMANPDRLLRAVPDHARWLSVAERERAARYRRAGDGERYLATRVLTRGVLAGLVGRAPGELEFVENAHGRPSLRPPTPDALDFNASRAPAWVVLVVSRGAACGIDVEPAARPTNVAGIARRFAPSEQALLAQTSVEERTRTFFALWTLKEAFLKALGTGLTVSLGAAAFTLAPGEAPRAHFTRVVDDDPEAWSFAQLAPDPHHLVAVAVRTARPALVVHGEAETCATVAAASR